MDTHKRRSRLSARIGLGGALCALSVWTAQPTPASAETETGDRPEIIVPRAGGQAAFVNHFDLATEKVVQGKPHGKVPREMERNSGLGTWSGRVGIADGEGGTSWRCSHRSIFHPRDPTIGRVKNGSQLSYNNTVQFSRK